MLKYLSLSLLAVLLVGCGEESEPIYDVNYYKTHEKERLEKLDWCKKSADRKVTTNCTNAHDAQEKLDVETMFGDGFERTKTEK